MKRRVGSRREGKVNSMLSAECIFHGVCKMLCMGACMTGFCNPHNLEILEKDKWRRTEQLVASVLMIPG